MLTFVVDDAIDLVGHGTEAQELNPHDIGIFPVRPSSKQVDCNRGDRSSVKFCFPLLQYGRS